MGIYIYKENYTGGKGLVFVFENSKPASLRTFNKVNGQTPYNTSFKLLETFEEIQSSQNQRNKDYKTWRDALKTFITDLGGGNVEAGFDLLPEVQKEVAAYHNIGSGTQIAAAIPDVLQRDAASYNYLYQLKNIVRPVRSKQLEAKTWSRCKKFLIEVAPSFFVTMPEVIYSQITINNPNTANGELGGNLLNYYEDAGIMGFAGGDKTLGILDYLYSTTGTRFQGAGIIETFAGIAPDGYNNITEFRDALADILINGELDKVE